VPTKFTLSALGADERQFFFIQKERYNPRSPREIEKFEKFWNAVVLDNALLRAAGKENLILFPKTSSHLKQMYKLHDSVLSSASQPVGHQSLIKLKDDLLSRPTACQISTLPVSNEVSSIFPSSFDVFPVPLTGIPESKPPNQKHASMAPFEINRTLHRAASAEIQIDGRAFCKKCYHPKKLFHNKRFTYFCKDGREAAFKENEGTSKCNSCGLQRREHCRKNCDICLKPCVASSDEINWEIEPFKSYLIEYGKRPLQIKRKKGNENCVSRANCGKQFIRPSSYLHRGNHKAKRKDATITKKRSIRR